MFSIPVPVFSVSEEAEQERAKVEPGFFIDDLELLELTLPQQIQIKDSESNKEIACVINYFLVLAERGSLLKSSCAW